MTLGARARNDQPDQQRPHTRLLRAVIPIAVVIGLLAFAAYAVSLAAVATLLWSLV